MKKLYLKKSTDVIPPKRIGYKIQYQNDLNTAQYEAVMHNNGAALVIAGAGTGKTRTLIYRVARLVEDGVPPESILLLTFTRKASAEMLRRASQMLDGRCERVSGGTFHSFALQILRQYANLIGYENTFSVIDQQDAEDTINLLRSQLQIDKTKKRFPKKETLNKIFNLSINKCQTIDNIVLKDFPFFFEHIDEIMQLFENFTKYKKKHNLMDYDDLLLNLLNLCNSDLKIHEQLNQLYKYVLVDEYQDTNKLQHEIVLKLAGKYENVMAVGDDAQSIYSFRGANFQNIMSFPESFNDCKIYTIEENYRSTQPILNLTNKIIETAAFRYEKNLYTKKTGGDLPYIVSATNERQQSEFIIQQILELRESDIPLEDIAILFRAGYLSFDLEIELNKANIPYKKYGGMKFVETAHIKDIISYFKILNNTKDAVSWHRVLMLHQGIGSKTSSKIVELIAEDKLSFKENLNLNYDFRGSDSIKDLFKILNKINDKFMRVGEKASVISDYYSEQMKNKYDDWQKRTKDIEMFITIAERYKSVSDFLNDMAIEPPVESVMDLEPEGKEEE